MTQEQINKLKESAQQLIHTSNKLLKEMDEMNKCVMFALNEWKTNKRWFREEPGRVTTEDVIKACIQYGWSCKGQFEYTYNHKLNDNDKPIQNN